jgi:hypothetical protein
MASRALRVRRPPLVNLGAVVAVDADPDIAVEIRERTTTPGDSVSWLEIRYAVTNTTDDRGELGYCCLWAALRPVGQEDSVDLEVECNVLRLCVSGPLISGGETLFRDFTTELPVTGEYRLGIVYRLPLQNDPRIAWSQAFTIR